MSSLRTMNTREIEKGSSIITSQDHQLPLSHKRLLTIPDLRLYIGSKIPIPFERDPLISYVGDNTFGRKRQGFHDIPISPNEEVKPFWCSYCKGSNAKLTKHFKTLKCQQAQRKSIVLPQLANVRTFLSEQYCLIEEEMPDPNPLVLPSPVTELVERFDVMSQLAVKGLPIDFGLSDFLMTNTKIPS